MWLLFLSVFPLMIYLTPNVSAVIERFGVQAIITTAANFFGATFFLIMVTRQMRWIFINFLLAVLFVWVLGAAVPTRYMTAAAGLSSGVMISVAAVFAVVMGGGFAMLWRKCVEGFKALCGRYPRLREATERMNDDYPALLRAAGLDEGAMAEIRSLSLRLRDAGDQDAATGREDVRRKNIGRSARGAKKAEPSTSMSMTTAASSASNKGEDGHAGEIPALEDTEFPLRQVNGLTVIPPKKHRRCLFCARNEVGYKNNFTCLALNSLHIARLARLLPSRRRHTRTHIHARTHTHTHTRTHTHTHTRTHFSLFPGHAPRPGLRRVGSVGRVEGGVHQGEEEGGQGKAATNLHALYEVTTAAVCLVAF